jgi:hypothetical protein
MNASSPTITHKAHSGDSPAALFALMAGTIGVRLTF